MPLIHSSSFKVIVNLSSRLISALAGIVFVPIYVKILGAESYGLVAFYGTLVGALVILDLGLSLAISRQVSILKATNNDQQQIKDLLYSVEIIYWAIAVIVGLSVISLSKPIAEHWVNAKDLSPLIIQKAVMLMGVVFAFQFPSSIYDGVMIGLGKQVPNAIVTATFSLVKGLGVVAVLKLVSPTIEFYFIWQAVITLVLTLILRLLIRSYLSSTENKASFSKNQLKQIWRFAAGMMGISLITFFLSQIDKIIVSKLVLLDAVGYYSLAFTLAGSITQVISPMQTVIFPKFTTLVAQNKLSELIKIYHKSCRWVAIIVFPIGFTLVFFAKEILLLWSRNTVLSEHTAPILQVFAIGTICNAMMWMPYFFLLAKGITKYTFYQNVVASIILVPMLFWWTSKYGALGASFVWMSVNLGYLFISIPLLHHLYIKGQLGQWIGKDVSIPFGVAVVVVSIGKYFQIKLLPNPDLFSFCTLIGCLSFIYTLLIPEFRPYFNYLKFRRS